MNRATPSNTSFRSFSAGGARATVSSVDPSKLMQEIAGGFMKGESRGKIEAPQNYGFASVTFAPDKDEHGAETIGPETFISFMGGNRSFPVAGPIDDRRHRLKGLEPGDVALFRGKDDGQQFHMNGIGTFLSVGGGKKLRLQLVKATQAAAGQSAQRSARAGGEAEPFARTQREEIAQRGQAAVYKNESAAHFEVSADRTESVNKAHCIRLADDTAIEVFEDQGTGKVYLGGRPEKGHRFARVLCEGGVPSMNVYARID